MDILGFSVPLWVILLLIILVIIYRASKQDRDVFRRIGVSGPRPWPFIGNMMPYFTMGIGEYDKYLYETYGKIAGIYFGKTPSLILNDPEMVKQITVKQSESFRNRMDIKMNDPVLDKMVSALKDDHWKHVRSHLSPTFSGSKMRRMVPVLNKCCDTMVKNLAETAKTGDSFECREICGSFSMDAIASSAFGLQIDTYKDKDNIFVQKANDMLKESPIPIVIVAFVAPWLLPYMTKWFGLSFFNQKSIQFFREITEKVIKDRKENPGQSAKDFLQLMIASQVESSTTEDATKDADQNLRVDSDGFSWNKSGLTHEEIVANSCIFIIGGFMNNAQALSFVMYNLAVNPEAQEKAYAEISTVLGDNKKPDYDDLKRLEYISMCIDESLRIFPPATDITRTANEDVVIGGLHIPKDMVVSFPSYLMHHDPNVWPNPEQFLPERFTAEAKQERHPGHYIPFGMGPRNCVAQRLALMQTKLALVHLLQAYKLVTCNKTQIPVKLQKVRIESEGGLWIKVEPRQ